MRLLVTRPEADAAALAGILAGRGHEPIMAPVMSIRFLDQAAIPSRAWQALLVTSANGARALARRPEAAAPFRQSTRQASTSAGRNSQTLPPRYSAVDLPASPRP